MTEEEKRAADIPEHNENSEKAALTMTDEINHKDGAAVMDGPDLDGSKVKFINGVDASVDLGKTSDEFVGLTKDELMHYAKDPYWVRLRLVLLVLFWVAWFAMLAAAIVIIILAPKCPPRPNLEWWQQSAVYQVYPRTFQDTNNDGVGDLKGVQNHLGYLRTNLNVSAVRLSSVYASAGKDAGYDITDYKAVDPALGNINDFHGLVTAMHRKGIKLIIDFVPNHVSNKHMWFNESKKGNSPSNEYRDFFIWANGTNGGPPNNWRNVYGDSAWTFDEDRKEYYYHQFLASQPDLNLRNPEVREEMKNVLRFWLDQSVDGFHVTNAAYLIEGDISVNEPTSGTSTADNLYDGLEHSQTMFQLETYELITEWREVLEEYTKKTEKYKFMSVEAEGGNVNQTLQFYDYDNKLGADIPLNTALTKLDSRTEFCGGACVFENVHSWLGTMPDHKWSSWVIGSQDVSRVATRMGKDMVNAMNMLHLLLPGTPYTYYGTEIGMQDNTAIPPAQAKDVSVPKGKSRDPERTPMQWTGGNNAGFSNASTLWLPVNGDYQTRNVRLQTAHGAGVSNMEVFASLTLLRQEPSFQWGSFYDLYKDKNIFCFVRQAEGFDGYLVAINFGPDPATPDFHRVKPNVVPSTGSIAAHTHNFVDNKEEFAVGTHLSLDRIHLAKGQGVVFKWAWGDRPQETS